MNELRFESSSKIRAMTHHTIVLTCNYYSIVCLEYLRKRTALLYASMPASPCILR